MNRRLICILLAAVMLFGMISAVVMNAFAASALKTSERCIALIKQYDAALPYLLQGQLSPWIHNKAIQKARESRCVKPEIKDYLATLKIKERNEHP